MQRPFAAYDGTDPYFFVSYAHDDDGLVFPEMQWIRDAGFNVWYDDGIHVGTVWRRALAEALSKSAGLIFFCTAKSAASENCLKEINFALDQGKTIFVVQLDSTPLPLELQLSLNDRQALVKSNFEEDTYRQRLSAALTPLATPTAKQAEPVSEATIPEVQWRMLIGGFTAAGGGETELIAEDIASDLMAVIPHRFMEMHVSPGESADSATTFTLKGSVRQRGDKVRVNLQVWRQGSTIWTRNYERPADDFYAVQDNLVNEICGDLVEPVLDHVSAYYREYPDEKLDVFGALARCYTLRFSMVDKASRDRLLSLSKRTVEMAPDNVGAQTIYAFYLNHAVINNFTRHVEETIRDALTHIDIALSLAPNHTGALQFGSVIHRQFGIESLALQLAEKCTAITGRPSVAHYCALLQLGRIDEMLELLEGDAEGLELRTIGFLMQGDNEAALAAAQARVSNVPQHFISWSLLASALEANGRRDEARQALAKVKQMVPGWTVELHERGSRMQWRNDERIVEAICGGLRQIVASGDFATD